MLFIRSLHDIYYDIFRLVKLGFTPEYVEAMSPSERGLFKTYSTLENQQLNTDSNIKAAEAVGLKIEDLI